MSNYKEINVLLGKTPIEVTEDGCDITIKCSDGSQYWIGHQQDCCENVSIEDIEGDLQSLIGNPILVAEEVGNDFPPKIESYGDRSYTDESYTWTFYKLATIKGHVDIRWYGTSNGYYSESVDIIEKVSPNA